MVSYNYHGFIADSEIGKDQQEGGIFTLALKTTQQHIHHASCRVTCIQSVKVGQHSIKPKAWNDPAKVLSQDEVKFVCISAKTSGCRPS